MSIRLRRRKRGDAVLPQLLQNLAELSKLTTGRSDWRWVGEKIKMSVQGNHHGDEMQQADWARKTPSRFYKKPFGLFHRQRLKIDLRPRRLTQTSSAGLEGLLEHFALINTSKKLKNGRPIIRKLGVKKHDNAILISHWRALSGKYLNYNCPHCSFACLDKAYTLAHIKTHSQCKQCSRLLENMARNNRTRLRQSQ